MENSVLINYHKSEICGIYEFEYIITVYGYEFRLIESIYLDGQINYMRDLYDRLNDKNYHNKYDSSDEYIILDTNDMYIRIQITNDKINNEILYLPTDIVNELINKYLALLPEMEEIFKNEQCRN